MMGGGAKLGWESGNDGKINGLMGNGSFVTAVKWGESQNEVQMEILQAFYIRSQNRAKEID